MAAEHLTRANAYPAAGLRSVGVDVMHIGTTGQLAVTALLPIDEAERLAAALTAACRTVRAETTNDGGTAP